MGLYQQALQNPQVQAEIALNPSYIETVQAQAAQQITQANMAMMEQQAQQPTAEQQMLQIEAQKLQVEAAKNQTQATKARVDAELKNRDLDLKQQKIILDAQAQGAEAQIKVAQKEEDRNAKRTLKAMDVLADLIKAQEANDLEEAKVTTKLLADVLKQQGM
jgi:hypothetical protein